MPIQPRYLRLAVILMASGLGIAACSSQAPQSFGGSTGVNADMSFDAPGLVPGSLPETELAVLNHPPNTDMVVAYSNVSLQNTVSVDYVVSEWQKMKLCLDASSPAPYVVIVEGYLQSVPSDDVLFNYEGRRLATATWNREWVNVARVSSFDFDGSQGNPGFHLRSILGRYLWALNDLPVSAYNTDCASAE